MKKIFVLFIIVIMCFSISSCQSTPVKDVVNQRSYEKLLEENQQNEIEEYPTEFFYDEFESKDGKVNIVFDAEVITPDVDKYPVIQIDPQPITNEVMQLIVDEFMEGETGCYPENSLTKSEIEDFLLGYYAKLNNYDLIKEEYEKNMPGAEIDYEAVAEAIKRRIANYAEMLESAPEEKDNILSYYNLRPLEFYHTDDYDYINTELAMTQEELDIRQENPQQDLYLVSDKQIGDQYLRLIVYNELPVGVGEALDFGLYPMEHYQIQVIAAKNCYLQLSNSPLCSSDPINTITEDVENFDAAYPDLSITEEAAVQLAEQVMDNLDISNFYLANTRLRKEYPTIEEIDNGYDSEELNDKFYILTFKPEYYGIPLLNASNRFSNENFASLPFAFEEIKMIVSNNSIAMFEWTNPTDVTNVINENANLISFDEITEIAEKYMKLKYNMVAIASIPEDFPSYKEQLAKYLSANIKITKICLGLGGTQAYNNSDEYMLIPIWSFYGSYEVDMEGDDSDFIFEDELSPLLSINAVDGSVVEQLAWVDYD